MTKTAKQITHYFQRLKPNREETVLRIEFKMCTKLFAIVLFLCMCLGAFGAIGMSFRSINPGKPKKVATKRLNLKK